MRWIGISVLLAAACATGPTKLVERAIDASGGDKALGEIHSYHVAMDGTWAGEPFSVLTHLRDRSDWRWQLKSDSMGEWSVWVLGGDEDTFSRAGGKTFEQAGLQRGEAIMHKRVETSIFLPDSLLKDDVALEKAEPVTIGGRVCPAVSARFGESKPVLFAFDPETDRIRQVQFPMLGPDGKTELVAVMDLGGWEDTGGIQVARKIHMAWGAGTDRSAMHEEITEIRWNPPIPPGTLATPEVDPLPEMSVKAMPETRIAQFTFEGPFNKIPEGIQQVITWVMENGGQPAGNVSLLYPEMGMPKTLIQIPVKMESAPKGGAITLRKRGAFQFAHATYEGQAGGSMNLIGAVLDWCGKEGYTPTGHIRMETIQPPNEEGMVVVEIGFPVRQSR